MTRRAVLLLLLGGLAGCQEITIYAEASGSATADAAATVEQTRGGQTSEALNPVADVEATDNVLEGFPGAL